MSMKVRVNAKGATNSYFANGGEAQIVEVPNGRKGQSYYSVVGKSRFTGESIAQWLDADEFEHIGGVAMEAPSKAYKPVHGGYPG